MTKYWSREDTQHWILQLENRIEDIDYYLMRTVEWCERYGIWDDEVVFALSSLTVIWVSHMRGEPISRQELLEILNVNVWEEIEDAEYTLNPKYLNMDLDDMLEEAVQKFRQDDK
jgi:hypothetical protein